MNIKKSVLVAITALSFVGAAGAAEYVKADESKTTNLCMTAIEGNRAVMFNQIKTSGLTKKFVVENVTCNGENILAFVEKHGRNANSMLKTLEVRGTSTSITDLAMVKNDK